MVKAAPVSASLDTNILLLRLVAETDPTLLTTFKWVSSFELGDLRTLAQALIPFRNLVTTPHVLAEVSNFVDQAPTYRRSDLLAALTRFIHRSSEIYEAATALVSRPAFNSIGLADTGLLALSKKTMVVTTDYQLWNRIAAENGRCINFNHLRSEVLLRKS